MFISILAQTSEATGEASEIVPPLVTHPMGILAVLLAVLAGLFWFSEQTAGRKLFKYIPMLVFCYFLPTLLTTLNVLPDSSPLYSWVKSYLLPCSLLLLVIALDVPGILRLGPKAVIMLLAGTLGVVLGGPIALFVGQSFLSTAEPVPYVIEQKIPTETISTSDEQTPASITPSDDQTKIVELNKDDEKEYSWSLPSETWRGLSALAGSWIGGGANYAALGTAAYEDLPVPNGPDGAMVDMSAEILQSYRTKQSDEMLGLMVIVDVGVGSIWMAILLISAGHQRRIDKWTGADTQAIDDLRVRLVDFQERVSRVPSLTDIMIILGLGFGAAWLSFKGGEWLADTLRYVDVGATTIAQEIDPQAKPVTVAFLGATSWKFILVTTLGIALSFTRARNLEGAGASKFGSAMLYILIACIGAGASFSKLHEAAGLIIIGAIWMLIHITVMLVVGKLIKAPLFFIAVGSQANIGGAASAPVVASAFHPALAPVGALLAIAGYVLGTYAGLLCMAMLRMVAETG